MGLSRQAKSKISRQTLVLPPLIFAVGGALPMAHALRTGTAWDRQKEDYAYSRGLDKRGWAWEFLRRNPMFQMSAEQANTAHPLTCKHVDGTRIYKADEPHPHAEMWGLSAFPNLLTSSVDGDIFWHPLALSAHLRLRLIPCSRNTDEAFALGDFKCRRTVLRQTDEEQLVLQRGTESVRLTAYGQSLLEPCAHAIFEIEGFAKAQASMAALHGLSKLYKVVEEPPQVYTRHDAKWHDYLIALDGHLAGRSYRDIAEILYGSDCIGPYWTDDSRGYKSKVRRAVERGLALMNGGYRDLL
jgi:hypothetical protein